MLEDREINTKELSDSLEKFVDKHLYPEIQEKDAIAKKTGESSDDEESPAENSFTYSEDKKNFRRKGIKKGTKQVLFGGAIGGGIAIIIITMFVGLLPLKIIHIFENLQSHFFSSGQQAVQGRAEQQFSDYLKLKVLPGLSSAGACHSTRTIDKNCVALSPTDTIVGRLFNNWRDARLENTLANKYNIEISRIDNHGTDSSYKITIHGTDTKVDINGWAHSTDGNKSIFTAVGNRSDVKQVLRDAFANETKFKPVMFRFRVGGLLQRKFGIQRCVFACPATVDKFYDWKDQKTQAAKMMLIRRVIIPHQQFIGVALECILTPGCADAPAGDTKASGTDNQRQDPLEKQISGLLEQNSIEYSADTVAKITSITSEINKYNDAGSLSNYLIDKLVKKYGNEFAIKYAEPVVGWIDMGSRIIYTVSHLGPKVKRWSFVIGSTSMVSYYMLHASLASEIKSGHTDAALVGSVTDSLGSNAGDATHKNQPAESAPIYSDIMGSSPTTSTAISSFLPSSLAAGTSNTTSTAYTCDNNKQPDPGKKVCNEESLVNNDGLVAVSNSFNQAPLSVFSGLADAWHASAGAIIAKINNVAGIFGSVAATLLDKALSGTFILYDKAKQVANDSARLIMNSAAGLMFASPVSTNMSGARSFDMLAGGADAAGNDFSHYGLGAKQVSNQTADSIRSQQANQDLQDFKRKPLLARLFSQEDGHSLISQVASMVPIDKSTFSQTSFASLISVPFTKLIHGFSFMLPGLRVTHAATSSDPFGIPQFAYDPNDPEAAAAISMPSDSPELSDKNCDQMNKDWASGEGQFAGTLKVDPDTGMDVHTKVDPCLLNAAAAASAGGLFGTDVLSPADIASTNGGSSSGSVQSSTGGCVNPFEGDPNWGLSRTDDGVDYLPKVKTGGQVIKAICDGVIKGTSGTGWPGGTFIYYKLTSAPPDKQDLIGKCIYVAENIDPAQGITEGSVVKAGQTIATTRNDQFPWTEWGWAQSAQTPSSYNGPNVGGASFARFLRSLGAKTQDDPGPGPYYAGQSCK